jgi:hypothetical protein
MSIKPTSKNKKIIALCLAFVFCAIASASAAAFPIAAFYQKKVKENESQWQKVRVADPSLYSENGYIDYANEVFLDVENYPDLKEMGLFWSEWDESKEQIVLTDSDTRAGADIVDPDKPTIIFVHGMLTDGYYSQEKFFLNIGATDPSEFGLETERVSLIQLWLLEGWNVGVYHYNRFASESAPTPIESKIWSTEGPEGVRIRHEDNTVSHVTEYTVAEHFVADYLRAMNLLPDTMGDQEIRISAHSMGGELMAAGLFLLTELASVGQLDYNKLPNRYSMLDTYFCVNMKIGDEVVYMGPKDIKIRWTGKGLYRNNTGYTIMECLKDLEANGIAMDYYTHKESFLLVGMPEDILASLKSLSTFALINPNYASYGKGFNVITSGHNGIRDWYYCSIRGNMVKYDDETSIFRVATSAKTPTEVILAQKGMAFKLTTGYGSVNANDDVFVPLK